jgi:hypothetical protein
MDTVKSGVVYWTLNRFFGLIFRFELINDEKKNVEKKRGGQREIPKYFVNTHYQTNKIIINN